MYLERDIPQNMSLDNLLLEQYYAVRQKTTEICSPLEIEDYVIQPDEFVSPPKWHLAHTSWFFETFVLSLEEDYEVYHPDFSFLFNSYYQHVGQRTVRFERGHITRPTVAEVYKYRSYIDEQIALRNYSFTEEQKRSLQLGLQHEQQHQELLWYDVQYILSRNPLFPKYKTENPLPLQTVGKQKWLPFEKQIVTIGHEEDTFCYDNEKPAHEVLVHPFSISNQLVTNGEYLKFMECGGYVNFEFWLAEGWDWVEKNRISQPLYWNQVEGQWHQFTLGGNQKIILNEPLRCISFYEADAYARWAGCRLPTEFEWELASESINHGELWEWTQSAYLPYPGYEIEEGALGEYNGKFMVNQKVLRGGSVASPIGHVRKTYRNFFHPNLQWMQSGIRLAK